MKVGLLLFTACLTVGCAVFRPSVSEIELRSEPIPAMHESRQEEVLELYSTLISPPAKDVFMKAVHGYDHIPYKKKMLTIIDFSLPSTEKRAWIIDMDKRRVLFNTWVSHGVNSGENMAHTFSNTEGSRMSSLGFYLTAETYKGKHGRSLRLDGLERGFNDSARTRYIVIHGADYVSPEFIEKEGRLGRSWGCPAFPKPVTKPIIRKIKGGTVLYIYGDDPEYFDKSLYSLRK